MIASRPQVDAAVASPGPDPLHPASGLFSLGRPFGLLPATEEHCPYDLRPFGLRQAVVGAAVAVDLAGFDYDHDQQIGIVRDGGGVVPLLRHTTGQTRSVTHPDGQQGPDSDTDHSED